MARNKGLFRMVLRPEGAAGFSPGFQPDFNPGNRLNARRSRGERLLSRRDRLIVARHEVPGVMRKIAPSQRDD